MTAISTPHARPRPRPRAAGRARDLHTRRGGIRRSGERAPGKSPILGRYTDSDGKPRELIARHGAAGSTLVIDRQRASEADGRLVAHLAADEPAENADVVCRCYLLDRAAGGGRCRLVRPEDFHHAPSAELLQHPDSEVLAAAGQAGAPVDSAGCCYRLESLPTTMSIPQLRWCRGVPHAPAPGEPVSLREAVGALESYEPVRALTLRALSRHDDDGALSTAVLRAELVRVQTSPIVLNRRLRLAVTHAVERGELSMSEIAIRCGRVKYDRRGNEAGETSWLARRIGLLPEGGQATPTPWIHTDVLALIARHGLGMSPHEVEL